MSRAQQRGDQAEAQALAYLQKNKLTLLERNYRCRHGEIDLVMQDGAYLVFVEVRRRARHSDAAGSIDEHKRQRLVAAANLYLSTLAHPPMCRFDTVLIDRDLRLKWLKDAFDAG